MPPHACDAATARAGHPLRKDVVGATGGERLPEEEISSAATIRKVKNETLAPALGSGPSLGIKCPIAFLQGGPSAGSRTSKWLVWGCVPMRPALGGPGDAPVGWMWQGGDSCPKTR